MLRPRKNTRGNKEFTDEEWLEDLEERMQKLEERSAVTIYTGRKPTVHELEKILEEGPGSVVIQPDGSILTQSIKKD